MSAAAPRFHPRRLLGRTGFVPTRLGAGDLADRRYETEVLPLAKALGAGTVCFKTFGAGKLLGDTEGYSRPLQERPRGKVSSGGVEDARPALPRLSVEECVRYTLSLDPDVALLGLSFPNEQDAAFAAAAAFEPLPTAQLAEVRLRAEDAIRGKGPCWWNPAPASRPEPSAARASRTRRR